VFEQQRLEVMMVFSPDNDPNTWMEGW